MENVLAVTWATLAGLVGTGLGGLIGCLGRNSKGMLPAVLGFTSGLMTAIVCFGLMPEAVRLGSIPVALAGFLLGAVAVWAFSRFLPGKEGDLEHTGYLVLLAIALHNLPEGLAIGSGWAVMPELGIKLALVIGMHDLPEGMAITAPLAAHRDKLPLRQVLLALLTGVPTGIGALLGLWLGSVSPVSVALCIGFAGGSMMYVTAGEMIPRLFMVEGRHKTTWQLAGLLIGLIISFL